MNDTWRKAVGALAPTIATMLGGPFAGAAVGALSKAVLGKEDGTEEELAQAIKTATPDTLARIKEAEAKLKGELAAAGVELRRISGEEFRQVNETARVEAQSTDEYVRRTRPKLARQSFYIGVAYLIFCALCSVIKAVTGHPLPGIQEWILMACWSPLLSYIGFRGIESFSAKGKV